MCHGTTMYKSGEQNEITQLYYYMVTKDHIATRILYNQISLKIVVGSLLWKGCI